MVEKLVRKQWIEIIGVLGVIGSLVFVGLQLGLDRQIAIAEQYQNRAESRLGSLRSLFENSEFIHDRALQWEKTRPPWWSAEIENYYESGYDSMDALVRSTLSFEMVVVSFDNNYFQYHQGLLDEGFWQKLLGTMRTVLEDPIRRAYWKGIPVSFETETLIMQLETEINY